MVNWRLAVLALACVTAAQASFNCPEDSHSFYHADVSTGCQVYHFCENSQLQTLTCPSGQAFNHETSRCEDASTVNCYETMDHHSHHHHRKRSIQEYHTIDIQEAKTKIIETYNAIKPIIRDAARSIAPTIYDKFDSEYVPAIKKFKNDIMPYANEKVIPQVRKYSRFVAYVIGQVIEKVHNSYQRSNSTHITVASFSDLATEITNELKPLLDLLKFLSDKVVKKQVGRRQKRDFFQPLKIRYSYFKSLFPIEITNDFVDYIAEAYVNATRHFFYGDEDAFGVIKYLILPDFYNGVEDKDTRHEILPVILHAFLNFNPVLAKIGNAQTHDTPEGTIVKIPKVVYYNAVEGYLDSMRPFIRKMAETLYLAFRQYYVEDGPIPSLYHTYNRLASGYYPEAENMEKELKKFFNKHRRPLQSSTGDELNFYPLDETMEDFRPVRVAIYEIFKRHFCYTGNDLWLIIFFNDLKKSQNICD